MAVMALLLAGCAGNTSKEEAAAEAEALEVQKIDSITSEIDSLKQDIDAAAKEIEGLVDEL